MEDYGLALRRVHMNFRDQENTDEETVYEYLSLASDRMIIGRETEEVPLWVKPVPSLGQLRVTGMDL